MSRVVVVVGASSGIGRSVAQQLAARGDHLVLMARAQGRLTEVTGECERQGAASAQACPVDVTDAGAVDAAMAAVRSRHGRIDAVVHSAGVVAYGRFDAVPAAVWDGVLRTNVLGAANVARSVLPDMRALDHGTLVLVGSLLGEIAVPDMSAYVVSKWAVRALGRELQLDNRDRPGVHVSVVSPGGVDTPIYAQAANYVGRDVRPPPPVYAPDTVAAAVVDAVDRPRKRVAVGVANAVIRLGFTVTPSLYDVLVGPLFTALAKGRSPVAATTGNVLAPLPGSEAVGGGHGFALWAVTKDLGVALGRALLGHHDPTGPEPVAPAVTKETQP
ncbi:MAG: SDR family NAD(P)-dependent oxidoreductase [Nocardioidaceae bacterium]|nr:SDR family NAD(P)-dependent oxidoreductase [Nocardioidaceae bacterium]